MIFGHLVDIVAKSEIKALSAAIFVALTALGWPARADDADGTLRAIAVGINQSAHSRSGTGIYLGNGYVLSASHVVGRALLHHPSVTIAGQDLSARIVKQDTLEQSDLVLLAIDQGQLPTTLRSRQISLCKTPPWPGEAVVTVVPEEVVHSSVLSPVWLQRDMRKYATVISDVARTGNSGSGVFDAQERCLLGIMSRKISEVLTQNKAAGNQIFDVAKYFVPASVISEFLPKGILEPQP